MGGAFKIGRLSGIDVKIHCTFFLLLAFFVFGALAAVRDAAAVMSQVGVLGGHADR